MRYPQDFVEKVMDSANLAEIISQHTQLKQSGGGYMGRCPFPDHKEKTPSFSVSEAKQVYHCFGCKKSLVGSNEYIGKTHEALYCIIFNNSG